MRSQRRSWDWTLGGMYSLRGYRYETVGPLDNLGEALGGDTYWFASAEYSIPLVSIVRYAFFYDIGNVYAQPFSLQRAPGSQFFNDDVGIGLIILFPLAIVSNALVPTGNMPGWLQDIANWNPVSAVTSAGLWRADRA